MSHFGRDLNQSGDGLPRRFQMLSYLLIGCVIGRDNYVSSSIIIRASTKPGTWNIPEHPGTFRNILEHARRGQTTPQMGHLD